MSAISESQLAAGLEQLYDQYSDNPNIDPDTARKEFAKGQAALIAQFVQGRSTNVTGTTSDGKSVTGTGTIQ